MKAKTLLPIVALCLGGSLGTSSLLADDADAKTPTGKSSSTSLRTPWNISEVMHAKVKDLQGDNLGQIKDVVVDPASGRAAFAVIQLSGDVGPAGSYAPVPWTLLSPDSTSRAGEPKTFTLRASRDQFASAQRLYLNHWPDSNGAMWGPQIYSYYGLDSSGFSFSAGGTGAGAQTAAGGDSSQYSRQAEMSRYGPTRADGTPIDNGSAPDGKGTFIRGYHWY